MGFLSFSTIPTIACYNILNKIGTCPWDEALIINGLPFMKWNLDTSVMYGHVPPLGLFDFATTDGSLILLEENVFRIFDDILEFLQPWSCPSCYLE